MNICNDTNFWLYVLTKQAFLDYSNYKGNYITFFDGRKLKKKDIIIIYNKDRLNSGFMGIIQLKSDPELDKRKYKIFKDNNLNRDYVKIKFERKFILAIKPDKVLKYLKTDVSGYKNVQTFRTKFLTKENAVVQLDLYGERIVNKLLEEDDINLENKYSEKEDVDIDVEIDIDIDIDIDDNKNEETEESNTDIESDNETKINKKKASAKTLDFIKKLKKKNIIVDDNFEDNNDNDDISLITTSDDSGSNEDNLSDNKTNDDNNNNGFIPIMIVPCQNYDKKLLLKNKNYFVNHYKSCHKCDITNNNNIELGSIIDNAKIETIEIKNDKHGYFNPVLDAYLKLQNYDPIGCDEDGSFIRVIYINNDHDIYDKCLLIACKE